MRPLLAVLGMLLAPVAFAAIPPPAVSDMPDTVFGFSSARGEWVGQGETRGFTPRTATFRISGNSSEVMISIQGVQPSDTWTVDLAAPVGESLHPRIYAYADVTPANGRAPGLNVYGNGRSCGRVWGEFGLRQITFDSSGNVTSIDASFTQRCGSAEGPAMSGVIRYRTPPFELSLVSDVTDPLAKGLRQRYNNDTSLFGLTAYPSEIDVTVRGQHAYWLLYIAPPTGQSLRPGKYAVSRFADATHAQLDFHGNGVGCNSVAGYMDVHRVERDQSGRVSKISVSFEQHCDGAEAALRGVLHYGI